VHKRNESRDREKTEPITDGHALAMKEKIPGEFKANRRPWLIRKIPSLVACNTDKRRLFERAPNLSKENVSRRLLYSKLEEARDTHTHT
jgi:hypothetical protein